MNSPTNQNGISQNGLDNHSQPHTPKASDPLGGGATCEVMTWRSSLSALHRLAFSGNTYGNNRCHIKYIYIYIEVYNIKYLHIKKRLPNSRGNSPRGRVGTSKSATHPSCTTCQQATRFGLSTQNKTAHPLHPIPTILQYDVDPLQKKEVFTMETRVFQEKNTLDKTRVFGVGAQRRSKATSLRIWHCPPACRFLGPAPGDAARMGTPGTF